MKKIYFAIFILVVFTAHTQVPVAVPDYASGMLFTSITVDVLSNDYDPGGEPIEIWEVEGYQNPNFYSFSGNNITYTAPGTSPANDSLQYRIRQVNNHNNYSDWTTVYYTLSPNPYLPTANDDFASTIGGIPVSVDVLENDILSDSLEVTMISFQGSPLPKGMVNMTDNILTYSPYSSSFGKDSVKYTLINMNVPPIFLAEGYFHIEIENNHSYDSLDMNNINAGFNANGMLFCNVNEVPGIGPQDYFQHFEAPKGSGKHTIFTNTIWIGGLDETDQLHLAAERYRQYGADFQPGPVSDLYDTEYQIKWNRLWKVSKAEIQDHINNWENAAYEPIDNIASWPGNGDQAHGEAAQLAPYFDNDADGVYDPLQGDYPLIRGDQCIFFIYNDDMFHNESQGAALMLEIHTMAYIYADAEEASLNNTVFIHYDLINRSDNTYHDTFFGIFTDIDLGYAWDDYVGSNVEQGSYFGYNGLPVDGNGEPGSYGENPPAQSITVLAGPYMDPDQEDNPDGGCDFSVNGLNFGNGIVDDERLGMTRFVYFNNSGGIQGDPTIAPQYYQLMQGIWKDGTQMMYGGNGHISSGAVGPECRFMFPGESDPLNWGSGCVVPNGGYNQNGLYWTEETADNVPGDRRGVGASGPFTMEPGQVQEIDLAFVFAQDETKSGPSVDLLFDYLEELRQMSLDGELIIPTASLDIHEETDIESSLNIYPNPAQSVIYIVSEGSASSSVHYDIFTISGTKVKSGILAADTQHEIDISDLENGFYIISVISDDTMISGKIVKQ